MHRLMEDHANLDFRDLLPHLRVPCVNFVGGRTACHHVEGIEHIGDAMPAARNVRFEESGHFLYWEEHQRFNAELGAFVAGL